MMSHLRSRVSSGDRDTGVYAVLYVALVVVLFGMSAIVVDIAALREDRRDNRAAADAAVLAGVDLLDPSDAAGVQPFAACQRTWAYLKFTLGLSTIPGTACNKFSSGAPANLDPSVHCQALDPELIKDEQKVDNKVVIVAWPVPQNGDANFLTPNISPGSAEQAFYDVADGDRNGCDRLGVAVLEDQRFKLAAAFGGTGTYTTVSSVARVDPSGGDSDEVAALNILNRTACETLTTSGGGQVLVGPTVNNGVPEDPGIISVESDASGCGSGSTRVINPNTASGGSLICAAATPLTGTPPSCDGKGVIRSFAMSGASSAKAYNTSAVPNNLRPRPSSADTREGWDPVTKLYGCETLKSYNNPSKACLIEPSDPTNLTPRNHIAQLVAALGGAGAPGTNYSAVVNPANPALTPSPYPGGFTERPEACGGKISTPVLLPSGNSWANCSITIGNGGQLVLAEGTLVVEGGIDIESGGCLAVNVNSCSAAVVNPNTTFATTNPAPTREAIVFLRGRTGCSKGCFKTSGKLLMPQTFVYSASSAQGVLVKSTDVTLWTAPGAGARKLMDGTPDIKGQTALEKACFVPAVPIANSKPDRDCMNSRFARLNYWSEFASPSGGATGPNDFAGQGSLDVVGVFFTPRAFFDFSGGGVYAAASAQFWSDTLRVTGQARLGLLPDARFAVEAPVSSVRLIR